MYYGVYAEWTDEDWTTIICSEDHGNMNRVNTFVNAFSADLVNKEWVQLGHQKRRVWTNNVCVTEQKYYWEKEKSSFGYNKGFISSPSPVGSHGWALNRMTTGMSSGISYCWHFRIDGITKHTSSGDDPTFSNSRSLSVQVECVWDDRPLRPMSA